MRQAWLSGKISKLSLETPTESSSSSSSLDSEEHDESDCDSITIKPYINQQKHLSSDSARSSAKTLKKSESKQRDYNMASVVSDQDMKNKRATLHRLNTSIKNDFWSVLRQKPQSAVPSFSGSHSEFEPDMKRQSIARATKLIMQEERVVKLFMKVEKLKQNGLQLPPNLPNI